MVIKNKFAAAKFKWAMDTDIPILTTTSRISWQELLWSVLSLSDSVCEGVGLTNLNRDWYFFLAPKWMKIGIGTKDRDKDWYKKLNHCVLVDTEWHWWSTRPYNQSTTPCYRHYLNCWSLLNYAFFLINTCI